MRIQWRVFGYLFSEREEQTGKAKAHDDDNGQGQKVDAGQLMCIDNWRSLFDKRGNQDFSSDIEKNANIPNHHFESKRKKRKHNRILSLELGMFV